MKANKKGNSNMTAAQAQTTDSIAPKLPTPASNVHEIPVKLIVVDNKFNARSELTEIPKLAEAIKREGLLQPVGVTPRKDGKYDLNFGFRRFAAVSWPTEDGGLGRTTIRATVLGGEMSEVEKLYSNLAENEARDDLSTWDRANRYLMLRDMGESNGAIAKRAAKTESYVSNLASNAKELIPNILKRWKSECAADFGGTRICTMDWLNKTRKLTAEEQQTALDKEMGIIAKPKEEKKESGQGRVAAPREPSETLKDATVAGKRELGKAIEACAARMASCQDRIAANKSEKSVTSAEKSLIKYKGVMAGLRFAAGLDVIIPGVWVGAEKPAEDDEE